MTDNPDRHLTDAEVDQIVDAMYARADEADMDIVDWIDAEILAATPRWRRWWTKLCMFLRDWEAGRYVQPK